MKPPSVDTVGSRVRSSPDSKNSVLLAPTFGGRQFASGGDNTKCYATQRTTGGGGGAGGGGVGGGGGGLSLMMRSVHCAM